MENERNTSVVSSKTSEGIAGWIESAIIVTSQTSLGQTFFKLLDSFLWGVEKSAQWSLPSHEVVAEENGKVFGKIELVRPLPWFLFLPGLVILRIIRSGLNVGAYILGYPQIQPSGMVKFVQKTRRRLRAISTKKCARRRTGNKIATPEEKSQTESVGSPIYPTEMKRKFSQLAECSTESSAASSDNEASKEVSFTEFTDILPQAEDKCNYDGEKTLFLSLESLESNSTKAEDTAEGVKRVDSSETAAHGAIGETIGFINGEIDFAKAQSTPKEALTPEVINASPNEKQTPKTSTPSQQASAQPQDHSSISK